MSAKNDVWPVLLSPIEARDRTEPGEISLDVFDCTPERAALVNCFHSSAVGHWKKATERLGEGDRGGPAVAAGVDGCGGDAELGEC
ncbi:hypothetical protein, partial [Amycolatopsis lurida]|uniref:hypothetical protein n=1 Tax=Amycolatopsis lurida TaxID=31959 RepID=UPI003651CAE4